MTYTNIAVLSETYISIEPGMISLKQCFLMFGLITPPFGQCATSLKLTAWSVCDCVCVIVAHNRFTHIFKALWLILFSLISFFPWARVSIKVRQPIRLCLTLPSPPTSVIFQWSRPRCGTTRPLWTPPVKVWAPVPSCVSLSCFQTV